MMMQTKVYKNKDGHFEVLIYDNTDYELYEMMNPMDANGLNTCISFGKTQDGLPTIDGEEVALSSLMQPHNLDLRTAIKSRQEMFYPY